MVNQPALYYLNTGIWWSMCHSNTLYSEAQLRQKVSDSLRTTLKITLRRLLDEKGSMLWCSQASRGHGRQPKIKNNLCPFHAICSFWKLYVYNMYPFWTSFMCWNGLITFDKVRCFQSDGGWLIDGWMVDNRYQMRRWILSCRHVDVPFFSPNL